MIGTHRDRHASGPSPVTETVAILAVVAVIAAAVIAVHVAAALDEWRQPSWNPLVLLLQAARGRLRLAPATVPLLAAVLGASSLLATAGVWTLGRRPRRHGADRAARLLATGRELVQVSARAAAKTADRFGVEHVGLPVARAVAGGQLLYATWEDMQTDIAGPRRLKTSARAIPTIAAAPGACFATSNKPDLYAATRLLREQHGEVWVLDPEGIAGEPAGGGGTRCPTSPPTAARPS